MNLCRQNYWAVQLELFFCRKILVVLSESKVSHSKVLLQFSKKHFFVSQVLTVYIKTVWGRGASVVNWNQYSFNVRLWQSTGSLKSSLVNSLQKLSEPLRTDNRRKNWTSHKRPIHLIKTWSRLVVLKKWTVYNSGASIPANLV